MKTERSAVPGEPDKLSERRGDDDQEEERQIETEADEQRVGGHEWGELIKKKKGVSVEQIHLEKRTEQKCSPKTFLGQSSFICQQLSLTLTQGCKIMVLCLFHSPPPPAAPTDL